MSGPLDFAEYLTPQQAYDMHKGFDIHRSLKEYQDLAKTTGMCEVCETLPIWKMVGTGMCFACTTGESDASEDYELVDS